MKIFLSSFIFGLLSMHYSCSMESSLVVTVAAAKPPASISWAPQCRREAYGGVYHFDQFQESQRVQKLMEFVTNKHPDFDPNKADEQGVTYLHAAAVYGLKDAVKALILMGARADVADNKGWTPLYVAVIYDKKEVFDLLPKDKALVNKADKEGITPLHRAVWNGNKEMAGALLGAGAEVDVIDNQGMTPLHRAVWNGNKEMTEVLLGAGAEVDVTDNQGMSALLWAVYADQVELIDLLCSNKADVEKTSTDGESPLGMAIRLGHLASVKALIKQGAKVHIPFFQAAIMGDYVEILSLLIEHSGADLNILSNNGWSLLHTAAAFGKKEICFLLLQKGARVDIETKDGITPLTFAICCRHMSLVDLFIAHGARLNHVDLNAVDQEGLSALHWAAAEGKKDIFLKLMEKGADISLVARDGVRTPLFLASMNGYFELIDSSLEAWVKSFFEKLTKASTHEDLEKLIRVARREVSLLPLTYEIALRLRELLLARRLEQWPQLKNWRFLKAICWPSQKSDYDALIAYLCYPIQYEELAETTSRLQLRRPLQYLLALSSYFGNILAQVQCSLVLSMYDSEEDELSPVDLVNKYFHTDISHLIELLKNVRNIPSQEGAPSEAKKLKIESQDEGTKDPAGDMSLTTTSGAEAVRKKSKVEDSEYQEELLLPAHFAALLCQVLDLDTEGDLWREACMNTVNDPLCMYHCAMRRKSIIIPQGHMTDAETIEHVRAEMTSKPPQESLLGVLSRGEDLLSKGLGAYGKARLADVRDERIRLFREAGQYGISGGYYDAAIIDEQNADELLEKAASHGVLGAYEMRAQRLIQKMATVNKQADRDPLITQVVQIYTLMGIRGDEQGYSALGQFLLKEDRRDQAQEILLKAGAEGLRILAQLKQGEERKAALEAAKQCSVKRFKEILGLAS